MRPPFSSKPLTMTKTRALVIATMGMSFVLSANIHAQDQATVTKASADVEKNVNTINVDIAAGSLTSALNQLARLADVALSYEPALTEGKTTQGLKGAYTLEQALTQLLTHTGLIASKQSSGSYVLVSSDADVGDKVVMLDSLQVTGHEMGRYVVTDAPSTTRSNVSIMETSRSIQVIDQNFINDANIQSLDEALEYVSGVTRRQRMGGVDKTYFVRGFRENNTYRNGKRELHDLRTNMNTVETVEVLKGPSSVRFGANSPGGIVNYTTKRPEAETHRSIKVRVDEHGQREVIGDFTGATNESGNVLYRFIAAGEDSESSRDFSDQKTSVIAPSFTFLLSDKTRLTASYELSHSDVPVDRGIPIGQLNNGRYVIADVPIDRRSGEPGDRAVDDIQLFDLVLAHQFSDNWQGELSYSHQDWEGHWSEMQVDDFYPEATEVDGVLLSAGSVIRERSGYISRELEVHQGSATLHGDFNLASIQHKVTLGADYTTSEFEGVWGSRG